MTGHLGCTDRGPHLGGDLRDPEWELCPPPDSPESRGPGTSEFCSGSQRLLTVLVLSGKERG